MYEFKYSVSLISDINDEQYNKLISLFSEYFCRKGFKIKSVIRHSKSTIIDFLIENTKGFEDLSLQGTTFGASLIILFLGSTIKEIAKKIVNRVFPNSKKRSEIEIRPLILQRIESEPSIIKKYVSEKTIRQDFREPLSFVEEIGCTPYEFNIGYKGPMEECDISIKIMEHKTKDLLGLDLNIRLKTILKKAKKS